MSNELFREKSLERISSPEELHDYMRVTSPRLWMLLTAIVVLLAGFIVYATISPMENTMKIKVQVENWTFDPADEGDEQESGTSVYATLPATYKDVVQTGMVVRIGQETGKVDMVITSSEDNELIAVIHMDNDRFTMPDGECDAELVLESTTPISFLWN